MELVILTLVVVLMVFLLAVMTLLIISSFINHKWFCTFWGWHTAPKKQDFDGCSTTGKCPVCGERLLQDSQGNWF